jgi:hypothetical protein
MNSQDWESFALVVTMAIEGITLVFYFRERAEKREAELELKQIKRRADAPFLVPSDIVFGAIKYTDENGELRFLRSDSGFVLSWRGNEVVVDRLCADWNRVFFLVDNAGEAARGMIVKLDGETISLKREADDDDSRGLLYLEYPYKPEKHGKEQTLLLSFETRSGVQDTHRYLTRHGFRVLDRIDPVLPQ